MQKVATSLQGVWELRPTIFRDARGYFLETFHCAKLAGLDLACDRAPCVGREGHVAGEDVVERRRVVGDVTHRDTALLHYSLCDEVAERADA